MKRTLRVDVEANVARVRKNLARNEVDGLLLLLNHDADGHLRLWFWELEAVEDVVLESQLVHATSGSESLPFALRLPLNVSLIPQ